MGGGLGYASSDEGESSALVGGGGGCGRADAAPLIDVAVAASSGAMKPALKVGGGGERGARAMRRRFAARFLPLLAQLCSNERLERRLSRRNDDAGRDGRRCGGRGDRRAAGRRLALRPLPRGANVQRAVRRAAGLVGCRRRALDNEQIQRAAGDGGDGRRRYRWHVDRRLRAATLRFARFGLLVRYIRLLPPARCSLPPLPHSRPLARCR